MTERRIIHICVTAALCLIFGGIAAIITGDTDILTSAFLCGVTLSFFWPLREGTK